MKALLKKLSVAVSAGALLVIVAGVTPASAVVIYDYSSANFTAVAAPVTTSDNLTVTLTLDSALAANLGSHDSLVSISGLSGFLLTISDGVHAAIDTTSGFLFRANVSTDSSGDIAFWQIALSTESSGVNGYRTDHVTTSTQCFSLDQTSFASDSSFGVLNNSGARPCTSRAGEWVQSGGTAVPEPATLALVGAGLAGLGFARRKRRQRH